MVASCPFPNPLEGVPMKRAAIALVIFLACVCAGNAQELVKGVAPSEPVSVRGNVTPAKLIYEVVPKYPKDAKKAGVSGRLVLKAVITKDGWVKDLQYVSGPDVFLDSAMKAVKKWRYEPTLFDGNPIEVKTIIAVNYVM